MKLWVRAGDGDDYHGFDSFHDDSGLPVHGLHARRGNSIPSVVLNVSGGTMLSLREFDPGFAVVK